VRYATWVIVAFVTLLRGFAAWKVPLTGDEAYYWEWAKHLALGYADHPPMVAIVIRLGTLVAGDSELGVRLFSILLALPMSWAVYRTAEILFGGHRLAATAVLLLNSTMIAAVGTMIVTPDAPLLVASSFVLLYLAKVLATGRGVWWLAVGAAVGAALLSKYTALFFGPAIVIWLALVPRMRRWLVSPWPYLGGLVALAIFSPVIVWNAQHDWTSFLKQMGRARFDSFSPRFSLELIPSQVAFATPLVFILGTMGLYVLLRGRAGASASRTLINSIFWTIWLYFAWHALHNRVEANWLAPIYPAFAIAGAVAAHLTRWDAKAQRVVNFCVRWAAPSGIVLFALLVIQANTGVLTGFRRDSTVRSIGIGWRKLGEEIEATRKRVGATCVLAPNYGTTAWLSFYLPQNTCVLQRNQRFRWAFMPQPDPVGLSGKVLFVDEKGTAAIAELPRLFRSVEKVGEFQRKRGPLLVETVDAIALEGPTVDVFDRTPPPELW